MKFSRLTILIALISIGLLESSCKDDCEEQTWYEDKDGDGFGNSSVSQANCVQPEGYVAVANDQDDEDPNRTDEIFWDQATITFHKTPNADITLPENQDRITDNVWITRDSTKGIFNIALEERYEGIDTFGLSPEGTKWALGSLDEFQDLNFTTWASLHQGFPPELLNQQCVMHLEIENIYLPVTFLKWGVGSNGGGEFEYVRGAEN